MPLRQENAFQRHYFPEIPLNRTDGARTLRTEVPRFPAHGFVRDGGGAWSNLAQDDTLASALAHKSPAEIETQAYIRGFNKGEKAGLESARDKIDSAARILKEAVEAFRRACKRIEHDTEKEIVELALAVAERIVDYEICTNREGLVALVREALQKVANREVAVIKMNPSDIEFLDRLQLPLAGLLGNPDAARIEADEGIGIGGCLIETDGGDIDARIESKLRVVAETFRKKLGQAFPESGIAVTRGRVKA